MIDSYTHYVLEYLEGINKTSEATMQDFVCVPLCHSLLWSSSYLQSLTYFSTTQFNIYDPVLMRSNSGIRTDLFTRRSVNETLVTDFFGGGCSGSSHG